MLQKATNISLITPHKSGPKARRTKLIFTHLSNTYIHTYTHPYSIYSTSNTRLLPSPLLPSSRHPYASSKCS